MGPETPGAEAPMAQVEPNTKSDGAPQADVTKHSLSKEASPEESEVNANDSAQSRPDGSSIHSNVEGIETPSQEEAGQKSSPNGAHQSSTNTASTDAPKLSPGMAMFRQMEAVLLKHRKEWESEHDPRLYASRNTHLNHLDPSLSFIGPWNTEWSYNVYPKYIRPNPFELTHEFGALPPSHNTEEKDEFDIAIDYGAARNRVRKTFEWDIDRLFLMEDIAKRKRAREEEAKKQADLEKARNQNTTGNTGADGDGVDGANEHPEMAKGPALELNYVRWFTFSRLWDSDTFVVDVLVGDPILDDNMKSSKYGGRHDRRSRKQPWNSDSGMAVVPGKAPLPERIRIHSAELKAILADMLSIDSIELSESDSFVMVRPFKGLFHCHDDIRSRVERLEEKISTKQESVHSSNDHEESKDNGSTEQLPIKTKKGQVEGTTDILVQDSVLKETQTTTEARIKDHGEMNKYGSEKEYKLDESNDKDEDSEEDEESQASDETDDPDDFTQSERALQHMKSLRAFVDNEILAKASYLKTSECKKVFFSDLWYLFRPGEEVVGRDGKQAYRIVHVTSPRHRKAQPWDNWGWYNSEKAKKKKAPFSITCVYIDFDGSNIGPVSKTIDFKQFDGLIDITSLPVYPLRFHLLRQSEVSDHEWSGLESLSSEKRYRQHLINRGAKFLKVLGIKPMYYAGPTLGVRDDIESQVVIDFETAFTSEDGKEKKWQPSIEMLIGQPVAAEEEEEEDKTDQHCTGDCCYRDEVYNDTYIDNQERSRYVNSLLPSSGGLNAQPSIAVIPQPLKDLRDTESNIGYSISDHELVIMSYRVFGFVLRHRQWAELDLSYLTELHAHRQPVQGPQNKDGTHDFGEPKTAFDNLVLEERQKPMIQALVAQHFRDKEHKAGQASQMDIIKGKGKGLILLLHGAPGVGKTSTAEGVAELFRRPLFQITCGDLGTTAKEVEKSLDLNFTLANRWDCILLLDEADVFLAQRNKEDFQRNGLVAVFLRVLEYYAGVLFLTTNRVGDFDEAFTSRIHISLYYPELNCEKTIKVFEINIRMIEDRFKDKGRNIVIDDVKSFAVTHYNTNQEARWNGRQIRNACQTALALAEFEAQGNSHAAILKPDAVVHLKVSHFETVQKAYLDFSSYLKSLYGVTSNTRAQEGQVRAILNLMGENERKKDFRNQVRTKAEAHRPVTPVAQTAQVSAQPFFQPMYAPANQQFVSPGAPQQSYYQYPAVQQPIYPQYIQQPMGIPAMQQQQQQPTAQLPQAMQAAPQQQQQQQQSPQTQLHHPQPQPMVSQPPYPSPNTPQDWNRPVPQPENSAAQQPRTVPEMALTPPAQQQQQPRDHTVTATGSPWLGRSVQDPYSAGGAPPPGQSGAGGSAYSLSMAPNQGPPPQWPGTHGEGQ